MTKSPKADYDEANARQRQLADIEAGLQEAERGEFATDAEVAATIAKYTGRRRRKPSTSS